jgi:serine/threonine protein kinase
MSILGRLNHSHVIKLRDHYETSDFMVMELEKVAGGDLTNYFLDGPPHPDVPLIVK